MIPKSYGVDYKVSLLNKSIRSEYSEQGSNFNALFKPNIGFGLDIGFDFKKSVRLSLGHQFTKHRVIKSTLDLEDEEYSVGRSHLELKFKATKMIYIDIAYVQQGYLLQDLEVASGGVTTASLELANLNHYEFGAGLISKAGSIIVLTSFHKIHVAEQEAIDRKFSGHGTRIGIDISSQSGFGLKYNYINTILSSEGEAVYDERLFGLYKKFKF